MSSHATDLYSVYAKSSSSFDLESAVRVTRDVGYLCANFNLLGLSVLETSIYQFLLFDLSASWSVGELSSYRFSTLIRAL